MDNVEWYKVLFKKKTTKRVKVLDTGHQNQALVVVLPKKDGNKVRKQYLREYRQRPQIKKHRRQYVRDWNRRNPDKLKAIIKRRKDKVKTEKALKERARSNN